MKDLVRQQGPVIAALLRSDLQGPEGQAYSLYNEAYGFEMTVNKSWRVTALLLAPYQYMSVLTGVTVGMASSNVFAGAWNALLKRNGKIDLKALKQAKAKFLVFGHSRDRAAAESAEDTARKVQLSLEADCKVILCIACTVSPLSRGFAKAIETQLLAALFDVAPASLNRLAVAFEPLWTSRNTLCSAEEIQLAQAKIKKVLAAKWGHDNAREVCSLFAGRVTAENITAYLTEAGIDGVLLSDEQYSGYPELLQLLKAADSIAGD